MKIYVEKEIYIPAGIYCDNCTKKHKNDDGRTYCNEFGGWLYCANDRTSKIVKCMSCFKAIQKTIEGRNY